MRRKTVQHQPRNAQKAWVSNKRSTWILLTACIAFLCLQAGFFIKSDLGTAPEQGPSSMNPYLPDPRGADVPATPVLDTIQPNPDYDNTTFLIWTLVSGATSYKVYRDTSEITSIGSLTPIGTPTTNLYVDNEIRSSGTYWYAVVATNASGDSGLSNSQSTQYGISDPNLIYWKDFNNDTFDAYPSGWTCSDNTPSYNFFRVRAPTFGSTRPSPYLTASDNQGGSSIYGYTNFATSLTFGNLSFDMSTASADGGSTPQTYYVYLQTSGGSNIITFQILAYKATHTFTMTLGGSTVPTSFLEQVWYRVLIEFDGTTMSLMVNGTTWLSGIAYAGGTIQRLRIATITSSYGGGTEFDNFRIMKVTVPPVAPTLSALTPNPSINGTVNLAWSSSPSASVYYVYRNTSVITTTIGLTPVITTAGTNGQNTVGVAGTYYYVVVAGNAYGNSSISNCESVVVDLQAPAAPTLSTITPNPSTTGIINLAWNSISGAGIYYVYRNTSVITATIGLAPVITTAGTSGQNTVGVAGTYYYVVVAGNAYGNSSISNCQSVVVIPPAAPTLSAIDPNPSTYAIINLAWSSSTGATVYYVYRNTSVITTTIGLAPVITTATTSGQNTVGAVGTYYYVVVAGNTIGNSSISNCQSVVVIPPAAPTLSAITPDPSINGSINLAWSSSTGTTSYYVYRNTSVITTTNGLAPVITTAGTSGQDTVTNDGTYYYVVIAGNTLGNSSISNCQSVIVSLQAPAAPTLATITPNPSTTGIINLAWSSSSGAGIYYVYRNTSVITTTNGLTPVITTTSTSGQNTIVVVGTYYYVVVAGNAIGNSTISNCQSVDVIPPPAPTLSAITPNPSTTGVINLAWSSSSGATSYYVYRHTSVITDVSSLTPVITTASTSGQNTVTENGTYYYVVVAGTTLGNSSISNCQSVVIIIPRNYTMIVGVQYNWIDAVTGGTQLFLSDDGTSAQDLPFSFAFYDTNYTRIYVSANGWMSFVNTNPYQYTNVAYPTSTSTYDYAIAPYWDDLYPVGSGNQVYVKSGSNYWVIAWINVEHISGPTVGTFEVVIYANGTILFQYEYISYVAGGYTCGMNYGDGYFASRYTGLTTTTTNLAIAFSNTPLSITHPDDLEYVCGTVGHIISWTICDLYPPSPSYTIYCNGLINATGSWASMSPITINIDDLPIGSFNYTIITSNGRGALFQDEVWITVRSVVISHPVDFSYPERSIGNILSWTILAVYNETTQYTILRNDSEVASGSWVSGEEIIIDIDGLKIGYYNFTIIAMDGLGNTTFDEVILTVIPNMSHVAVTHPIDATYTTVNYGNNITWVISADNFADGNYTVYRNGINITNGTWIVPGLVVITDVDGLPVGVYNFTIVITDCWGVIIQDGVNITINLFISHVAVTNPPDKSYMTIQIGHNISWVISADYPGAGSYIIYRNGINVTNGTWMSSEQVVNISVDGLQVGSYNFTIVISDLWEVTIQDEVIIIITPPTSHLRINTLPDLGYIQEATGNFLIWIINAENGGNGTFKVLLDGTMIKSGTWQAPGGNIKVEVDGLSLGQHQYDLVLDDYWGANVQDQVIISVNSPADPMLGQFIKYLEIVGAALAGILIVYAIIHYRTKARANSLEAKYSKITAKYSKKGGKF